jgi:Holliday junction resolvase-like predicted endonuclease
MPNPSRLHFGWSIETLAAAWYARRFPAARLVARNFTCRRGEIDLVFEEPAPGPGARGIELVFIEVRARLAGSWESGLESIGVRKQLRLSRAIGVFLTRYRGPAASVRLDALCWDGKAWEHVRDLRDIAGEAGRPGGK